MNYNISIKEIKKLSKKDHREMWYTRKVTRKISPYITWLLLRTPITANQTTILMIFVGVIAGILFVMGSTLTTLIGALIFQFFFILDHVDGEIARGKDTCNVTGVYLDRLANFIVAPLIFAGLSIGVYQQFPSLGVLIFGLIASWSSVLLLLIGSAQSGAIYTSLEKFLANGNQNSKIARENNKRTIPIGHGTKPLVPRFVPHILFNLIRKTASLWWYPGAMNIITIAIILDIFSPNLQLGPFEFNFIYLIIMIYAVTLPIMCILVISYSIISKTPDRLFSVIKGQVSRKNMSTIKRRDKT